MTNRKLNNLLIEYTKDYITPTYKEWDVVSDKYEELIDLLENKNCFQSGSCARFTAIKPVNDLDVIWIISEDIQKAISSESLSLENILEDLASKLEQEYKKIGVSVNVKPQTHSVGIYFGETETEFSIDIVPAKKIGEKNEFRDNILEVPEILFYSKKNRAKIYKSKKQILWKKSDPKGYRKEIKNLHDKNNNLRKVIRFIKKWRWNCKKNYPDFPLKSFHLELIIKDIFEENADINFLNAVELFYKNISNYLEESSFIDRADENKYVDEYVNEINKFDKNEILELSELAISRLNKIRLQENSRSFDKDINLMLSARDDKEQFIFDDNFGYKFKLDENLTFKINGNVSIGKKTKKDPFSNYPLKQNDCTITIGKNIEFYIAEDINIDNIDYYWKVKNRGKDLINKNGERECRGEITFNQTYNNPESTAYNGIHYVECYVISNRKCIAYDRVYVRIKK